MDRAGGRTSGPSSPSLVFERRGDDIRDIERVQVETLGARMYPRDPGRNGSSTDSTKVGLSTGGQIDSSLPPPTSAAP
ncbi:MAG TPA: hypothetical protein VLG74_09240 [Blastocatellia bacterium]|nr:hypothetical protein [Blastocatellia bacterium]